MIVVKLADIPIGIDNRYKYIENYARDYLTDEEPVFTVSISDDDIERERAATDEDFTPGYLESIATYRKIAERLPDYDAVVFHGAVLSHRGKAYAFTARSGVGKTTHTRLWLSEIGEGVHYLNGDNPIIRLIDGKPYAFGTPWRGKEGYGVNESAPLEAIALLERGVDNSAREVEPKEGVVRLIKQIYIPRDPRSAMLSMRVANGILAKVRVVELKCNMDSEAAIIAAKEMIQD